MATADFFSGGQFSRFSSRRSGISALPARRRLSIGIALLGIWWLPVSPTAGQSTATDVRLTVDTDEELHEINPNVYGHFLEHIYHSVNGGLWGELVWNRSFELSNGGEGDWSIEDGEVVQSALIPDVYFSFGDASWKDYEITLEARKERGNEGFMVMFRARTSRNFYWVNLGGWGNTRHAIEKQVGNRRVAISPNRDGRIESDRWYKIRVRVEGNHIQCWLDEEQMIDMRDDAEPFLSGMVGLATYGTHSRYRNLKVTSLDGATELFTGTPEVPKRSERSDFWTHFGEGSVSRVRDALNNVFSVELQSVGGPTGLVQADYRFEPQRYEGSLAMKGHLPEGVKVELLDGETVLGEVVLGPPTAGWVQYPFQIQSSGSTTTGSVRISLLGRGSVKLDQFMLMGEDALAARRFPTRPARSGSRFAPAHHPLARWMLRVDLSVERRDRAAARASNLHGLHVGRSGHQFVRNRRVHEAVREDGREAAAGDQHRFIAVGMRAPAQFRLAADDDYLPYALDWLEYCNGDATTPMGKLRAANGHPEPYNVEFWELDNETWAAGVDAYIEKVKQFAPALRAKAEELGTPIKLLACGGNRLDMEWNRSLIDACAPLIDYISIHNYEEPDDFASGVSRYEDLLVDLADHIRKSANPDLEIYNSEWNAQSTDWRTGLYAGGLLNAYERQGEKFTLGGPALFLRHTSAGAWDNAFINFDHTGWYPAPNYVVMKLWWDNYAPRFLPVSGDQRGCNVVATRSEDGDFVVLKAVNPQDHAVSVEVNLDGQFVAKTASLQLVAPGSLHARNTLEAPHSVKAEVGEVHLVDQRLSFEMPAYSVAVVRAN